MATILPVIQETGFCGPASLKIVFDSLGIKKSQEEWAKLSGATHEQGIENEGMLQAIKAAGFEPRELELLSFKDLSDLLSQDKRVILIWRSPDAHGGHYSPVVAVDDEKITIAETLDGTIKKIPLKTFEPLWYDFKHEYNRKKDDLQLRSAIVF